MKEHTVTSFGEELRHIDGLIRAMSAQAASMVRDATRSLTAADLAMAQRIVSEDAIMDARQRELDEAAITLIAKRQPMAQDLRAVVSALRMGADLERIGDLAKNIAKRVGAVGQAPTPKILAPSIESMADVVLGQVTGVVEHYVARDAEALKQLRIDDQQVDTRYTSIFRELLTYMMEDPRNITACTHLLFCAKNLERIGDHATNIAENAYYAVTGRLLPGDRPKTDETAMTASAE
jgi:phosphate transport system protein